MTKVTRYAYVNTTSHAGSPTKVEFDSADVWSVRKWHNSNGNPSYGVALADGRHLYLVDDYSGTSEYDRDLPRGVEYVNRKKDLFPPSYR